jgi:hypothetical protein
MANEAVRVNTGLESGAILRPPSMPHFSDEADAPTSGSEDVYGSENAVKMYVHPIFTPIVGSIEVRPTKAAASKRVDPRV